jgi:hypothetical protein
MCLIIKPTNDGVIYWNGFLWGRKEMFVKKDEKGHYVLSAFLQKDKDENDFVYPCSLINGHITIHPVPNEQPIEFLHQYFEPEHHNGYRRIRSGNLSAVLWARIGYHAMMFDAYTSHLLNVSSLRDEGKSNLWFLRTPIRFPKTDVEAAGDADIVVRLFQLPTPHELEYFLNMIREYAEQFTEQDLLLLSSQDKKSIEKELERYRKLHRELVKSIKAKA